MKNEKHNDCPCCSGKPYSECCGGFIDGQKEPSTPVELMRSRYTAYTRANIDYIVRTMKSPAADHFDPVDARAWAQQVKWIKLEVISTSLENGKGWVEFIAHYTYQNRKYAMHELSEFNLNNNKWYYVDGKTPATRLPHTSSSVGRNNPCPCGSGKKYKKCCGS